MRVSRLYVVTSAAVTCSLPRRAAAVLLSLGLVALGSGGAAAAGAPVAVRPAAAHAYPPVVAQALGMLAGRVRAVPLGAPTRLPTEPPSRTYLTALTRADRHGWSIDILRADQPYAVDNPAILERAAHAETVVRFGVARLGAPLSGPLGPPTAGALWRLGERARGLPVAGGNPPLPGRSSRVDGVVDLGPGLVADVYPQADGTQSLLWREGDWTLLIADTTAPTALALARAVVAYLHGAYLPPHPGLVVVTIGVHGLRTDIDWTSGHDVYFVDNALRAGVNPVAACALAVSWRAEG